jgi:hypothetical protein
MLVVSEGKKKKIPNTLDLSISFLDLTSRTAMEYKETLRYKRKKGII